MKQTYKDELQKGINSSKLTSHKQAVLRAICYGIIFGIALFSPVSILFKFLIGIVLSLVFGMIVSSKRFEGKI